MTENNSSADNEKAYGVIAESKDYSDQMILLNMSFGRLIDEIVKPYDNDEAFFIDGVPTTKSKITRIKIVELGDAYQGGMSDLQYGLTVNSSTLKTYGDQYQTRFEHLLRTAAIDVTAQVISAYNEVIKPSIKDYMPNRKELITSATKVFIEGMKLLNN